MKYYVVVSNILHWIFDGNSLEEAHAKAKSFAGKLLCRWKKSGHLEYPKTRKEVIRILHGKFEVKEADWINK